MLWQVAKSSYLLNQGASIDRSAPHYRKQREKENPLCPVLRKAWPYHVLARKATTFVYLKYKYLKMIANEMYLQTFQKQ